jgi:hypothetical protein
LEVLVLDNGVSDSSGVVLDLDLMKYKILPMTSRAMRAGMTRPYRGLFEATGCSFRDSVSESGAGAGVGITGSSLT